MKPMKPKFSGKEKMELQLSKKAIEVLDQYSKYTQYSQDEIIEGLIGEILTDDIDFLEWLKTRRYRKKIDELIFGIVKDGGEAKDEETYEDCDF